MNRVLVSAMALLTLLPFMYGGCGGSGGGNDDVSGDFKVSGFVMLNSSGQEDVLITLTGTRSTATLTDNNGYYECNNLPDGTYLLTPSLDGYSFSPSSISVSISGASEGGVSFSSTFVGYRISGTINANGSPQEGVEISLTGDSTGSATTDANGYYQFSMLTNGSYVLIPNLGGFNFSPPTLTANVFNSSVLNKNFTASAIVPEMISSGVVNSQLPQIALDATGNAIAVWQEDASNSVSANIYTVGVGWGSPNMISSVPSNGTSDPQISVNATGYGIAVWVQGNGTNTMIYSNRYIPGQGWGSPVLVSPSNTFVANPSVAIDGNGKAIAVWDQDSTPPRKIFSSLYDSSSGWSVPIIISSGVYSAYLPEVAMNPSGKCYVSFQEYDGTNDKIVIRSYDSSAGWGTPKVLSDQPSAGRNAYGSVISINSSRAVMVAWNHPGWMGRREIHGNFTTNKYGFSSNDFPLSIQNPYPDAGDSYNPDVAADENSDHLVVWEQSFYGQTDIYASFFLHDGQGGPSWTMYKKVSNGTGNPQLPKVAKYLNGNAYVAWEQYDTSTRNIYVNKYIYPSGSSSSKWEGSFKVNDSSNDCNSPTIAVSQSGSAIVVWSQKDGQRNNIYGYKIE